MTSTRRIPLAAWLVTIAIAALTALVVPAHAQDAGDGDATPSGTDQPDGDSSEELSTSGWDELSDAEIERAAEVASEHKRADEATVAASRQAFESALLDVAELDRRLGDLREEIDLLRRHAVARAIDQYVSDPGLDLVDELLVDGDVLGFGRKRALAASVDAGAGDVLDALGAAVGDLGDLEVLAARARHELVAAEGAREADALRLQRSTRVAVEVSTALRTRIESSVDEIERLAGGERELTRLLVDLPARPPELDPVSERLAWPAEGRFSSAFGPRWGRLHKGIDLAAPTGTPVRAAAPGTVVRAEASPSFGLFVVIDHGGDLTTLYAHLHALHVESGAIVETGRLIGEIGATGRSTGPHLHFETRVRGVAENPLERLAAR